MPLQQLPVKICLMELQHFGTGLLLVLAGITAAAGQPPLPQLRDKGETRQLLVEGKPFLILGGELGNSTASDLARMEQYWSLFKQLNVNTILAPVSWELIEPAEGHFDFTSLDGLLQQARRHQQRLVLLWFGSWKNSMSSYVPAWVKRNQARFPRVQTPDGKGVEILSPFSAANRDADARAFAAVMRHLRQTDAEQQTVIMVQVENEIGMLPTARDHSKVANQLFGAPVPREITDHLQKHRNRLAPQLRDLWLANGARASGSWEQVFGPAPWSEEIFMAWNFAQYVDVVTKAGKEAYPLPMFVNAALVRPRLVPGEYPSAGPLPHLFDLWKLGAPTLDFMAPDIYFPNYTEWATAYAQPGNPLFIPEIGRAVEAIPANAFHAIGELDAMGFSPFGIEGFRPDNRLGAAYETLAQLAPLILQHQGTDQLTGVRPPLGFDGEVDDRPQSVHMGNYTLNVVFRESAEDRDTAARGGLIIQLGPDEFLIAGSGLIVTFETPGAIAGIESVWEGRYENGEWKPGRLLNGDQTHQGRHVRLPVDRFDIQRVRLYRYR
jgi:beta-galactosidase GanA